MFSKENRRFTALLIALVVVTLFTLSGIFRLVNTEHSSSVWLLTGFASVVLGQIVGMLKSESDRREIKQTSAQIKEKVENLERVTNGNLTNAIQTVAEEVKRAKDEPAPGQEQMPRTPAELQSLIKLFLREMSEELVHRATAEAATRATRDAVELATRTAAKTVIEELREAGYRIERP